MCAVEDILILKRRQHWVSQFSLSFFFSIPRNATRIFRTNFYHRYFFVYTFFSFYDAKKKTKKTNNTIAIWANSKWPPPLISFFFLLFKRNDNNFSVRFGNIIFDGFFWINISLYSPRPPFPHLINF